MPVVRLSNTTSAGSTAVRSRAAEGPPKRPKRAKAGGGGWRGGGGGMRQTRGAKRWGGGFVRGRRLAGEGRALGAGLDNVTAEHGCAAKVCAQHCPPALGRRGVITIAQFEPHGVAHKIEQPAARGRRHDWN